MKRLLISSFLLCSILSNAQIGIGTSVPDSSAMLDVSSTTKGFLPPRVTQAQRDAIITASTGLIVFCSNCGNGEPQLYNGIAWVNLAGGTAASVFISYTVTSSTGKIWMDRNLGATQVATSSADAASYGDLYQWGRGSDGHQLRTSNTTTILSTSNTPGNSNVILAPNIPNDWRSPKNDNLWQGLNGVNNPCPFGFRIPTSVELNMERKKFSSQNSAGAFASALKLPQAGKRGSTGLPSSVGTMGTYWSSTVSSSNEMALYFDNSIAYVSEYPRAAGCSIRCIKD